MTPPTETQGAASGDGAPKGPPGDDVFALSPPQFSVRFGAKVTAGVIVLAGIAGGFLLRDYNSSTIADGSGAQQPSAQQPARIFDGKFGTRHVGPGESFIQVCISTPQGDDGAYRATFDVAPAGPVSGSGTVSSGKGEIDIPINQFFSYNGFSITGPDGKKISDIGPLATSLPWVVTDTQNTCDPTSLKSAPTTATTTASSTSTTSAPPWSLLLIPGSLGLAGGVLLLGRREKNAGTAVTTSKHVPEFPPNNPKVPRAEKELDAPIGSPLSEGEAGGYAQLLGGNAFNVDDRDQKWLIEWKKKNPGSDRPPPVPPSELVKPPPPEQPSGNESSDTGHYDDGHSFGWQQPDQTGGGKWKTLVGNDQIDDYEQAAREDPDGADDDPKSAN